VDLMAKFYLLKLNSRLNEFNWFSVRGL